MPKNRGKWRFSASTCPREKSWKATAKNPRCLQRHEKFKGTIARYLPKKISFVCRDVNSELGKLLFGKALRLDSSFPLRLRCTTHPANYSETVVFVRDKDNADIYYSSILLNPVTNIQFHYKAIHIHMATIHVWKIHHMHAMHFANQSNAEVSNSLWHTHVTVMEPTWHINLTYLHPVKSNLKQKLLGKSFPNERPFASHS